MKRLVLLVALVASAACASAPPRPVPAPVPAPSLDRYVRVTVRGLAGAELPATGTLWDDSGHTVTCEVGPRVACHLTSAIGPGIGLHLGVQAPGYVYNERAFASDAQGHGQDLPDWTLAPTRPPAPTKRDLMTAPHTFQGLFTPPGACPEYLGGQPMPIFDIVIDVVGPSCREAIRQAHRDAGDNVIAVAVSHAYLEPGIPAPISTGHDWSYDLPGLNRFLQAEIIDQGFYVQLHLAGDGSSSSKMADGSWRYNDPVGWTYGYEWLSDTWSTIADALDNEQPYIRSVLGFDGTFYGWTPEQVVAFGWEFKARWAAAVLGIEHDMGHIPLGEGGDDYLPGGRMQNYDMVFGEYPRPLTGDAVWQIIARMVPKFTRPAEMPAGDDLRPPNYLRVWPGVYVCWEWGIYDFVRNHATAAAIAQERQQLVTMGCPIVG